MFLSQYLPKKIKNHKFYTFKENQTKYGENNCKPKKQIPFRKWENITKNIAFLLSRNT